MKQFLSLAFIVAVFISSTSFRVNDDHKILEAPNNKVEVVFTRQLDFGDIVKIKLDMAQKGIILDYKKLQFDENGKLKAIDFSVDLKDGFSGSASSDELTNQSHFGFYRDYKEKVSSPFGIGNF